MKEIFMSVINDYNNGFITMRHLIYSTDNIINDLAGELYGENDKFRADFVERMKVYVDTLIIDEQTGIIVEHNRCERRKNRRR